MENNVPLPSEGKYRGRMLFTSTRKMLSRESNLFSLPIKLNPTCKLEACALREKAWFQQICPCGPSGDNLVCLFCFLSVPVGKPTVGPAWPNPQVEQ